MVGVFHRPECGPLPQAPDHSSQQGGLSERIPRALNESLGNTDVEKMLRAFNRGLLRRVQRKSQEHQAANMREWFQR